MALLAIEEQPNLLERIPVMVSGPVHRVAAALAMPGVQGDLIPGQRVLAVEPVGALRVAGIAIDRDPDQVASDGLGAAVDQPAPLSEPVDAVVVAQGGVIVIDHE
jgi:hypothetical protein